VVGLEAWLFAGSDEPAASASNLLSLIASAQIEDRYVPSGLASET